VTDGDRPDPPRDRYAADALVVLGGGVEADGSPTWLSCTRVAQAVESFRAGVAPRLILSGRCGLAQEPEPAMTEAAAMADFAAHLGVPRDVLHVEEESRDTLGNAYFTRERFLEPNRWSTIRVVTSDFHLSRAAWVFRKILGSDYDFSFVSAFSGLPPRELIGRVLEECRISIFLNEWLEAVQEGDDEAIDRLMLHEHPGYAEAPSLTHDDLVRRLHEIAHINDIAGGVSWIAPATAERSSGGRRAGDRRKGERRNGEEGVVSGER
jgi:uncharacterized SAM-binding protein YcdF (DUF218 family)